LPILPLDHPEPSFATLGVMLYPATDESDPPKAQAYVAQVLARAFSRFREAGGTPPYDVLGPILMDAGEPLSDLQERWWGGRATGELFKTLFALFNTDPRLASWKNAIQIVDSTTKSSKVKGARTNLLQARDRFLSERFDWHPHQTGKLTPKCRPRDFRSGARRNLARNCLCHLEPNPRTPKQRGIRSRIQPVPERHKIVL
jgi:hypothetical protein